MGCSDWLLVAGLPGGGVRDQPLQNEWLLHQGGWVDLALGVALAPRATGPRRGPNQGCLRHCSLREWCPPGCVVLACGVTDSSPGPNKGQLPGRTGAAPVGVRAVGPAWRALVAGQRAEVSSCRTSLFLSCLPLRHRGSDHRGSGGTRSSQRTAVRTGPDCGRRASPAAAAGMAWRGQDAGGRQRTGRPSPGEGFASETLIRNSCLLFNKHRTTAVKTYSLTSYEKPLSPTCAT